MYGRFRVLIGAVVAMLGTVGLVAAAGAQGAFDDGGLGGFGVRFLSPRILELNSNSGNAPGGATGTYTVAATSIPAGLIELAPGVTCAPPSGTFFPAGITRVECGANYHRLSDGVAVRDYISFLVVVSGPSDPAPNLSNDLRQVNNYLRRGDTAKACAALDTFIADVKKEIGHKLTEAGAAPLLQGGDELELMIVCSDPSV